MQMGVHEQSIDNGLEPNQGPGLARHTNSPKNWQASKNESSVRKLLVLNVCPINPTIYLLMPMKIHSLIERTIINLLQKWSRTEIPIFFH